MYYYISGKLIKTDVASAVVDNHGVAYYLNVSANTLSAISGKDEVKLYTYLSIRENAQELFGFHSEEELAAFRLLLDVSGVGAKVALAILSVLTPEKLATAVSGSDVKAITAAQGVGKKLAERVVLELKDKFGSMVITEYVEGGSVMIDSAGNAAEAINALVVLGYSRAEASHAVGTVDTMGMEIDDIIRAALKRMM